ncbi:hypothetical protein [Terrisporobacter vanillatitrophus]|uniref:hypothetical protein n=1 Tax=Terrisporobacter vanillatitrophus TaxID=3058402 RepID=UPI003366EA21
MSIQRFEGNGRMSKAVVFNNTIYLCGQTCVEAKMAREQLLVEMSVIVAVK